MGWLNWIGWCVFFFLCMSNEHYHAIAIALKTYARFSASHYILVWLGLGLGFLFFFFFCFCCLRFVEKAICCCSFVPSTSITNYMRWKHLIMRIIYPLYHRYHVIFCLCIFLRLFFKKERATAISGFHLLTEQKKDIYVYESREFRSCMSRGDTLLHFI